MFAKNMSIYCVIFLIVIGSIFLYGKLRCSYNFNDILGFKFNKFIDGWVISHFLVFLLIGYLFPETFYLTMALGILWEVFEWWVGITKPAFLKDIGNCRHSITNSNERKSLRSKSKTGKTTYWWYGQYEDIIADFLGFMVGKYICNTKCNKHIFKLFK